MTKPFLALLLSVIPVLAQVDDLVARCAAALGGDAAARLQTVHMRGSIKIVNTGAEGTTEVWVKAPDRRAVVSSLPGLGVLRTVFDGTSGWIQPLGYAPFEASGAVLDTLRRNAAVMPVLRMKELFAQLTLEGGHIIVATPKAGRAERWHFDSRTFLPVRVDAWTAEGLPAEIDFDDYRTVAGVKFPFTLHEYTPVYHAVSRFESIQVNVPVDGRAFEKPR